jgi:CHASE3 domain sensor protein
VRDHPLLWPTVLFVLLAGLVTSVGVVGDRNLDALTEGFSWVAHSRAVLDELSGVRADAIAAQSHSRGYRMSDDATFLGDFAVARDHGRATLVRLRGLVADSRSQSALLDSLDRECEDLFTYLEAIHAASQGDPGTPPRARMSSTNGRQLMTLVDQRVDQMRAAELVLLERRSVQARETAFIARLAGLALAAATVLLGVLVYVLFARTVRDQAREAREQHRRATELAEADRRKDEFLAMLGHELRNPLAPIRMALHVLDHEAAPAASMARAREILDQQVTQMTRLVNDLMDVSRVALGKLSL